MNLYRVENDFSRENLDRLLTYCLVVAETEDIAIEIAKPKFKEYYDEYLSDDCNGAEDDYYTYSFYNELKASIIFEGLDNEKAYFQGEVKN